MRTGRPLLPGPPTAAWTARCRMDGP